MTTIKDLSNLNGRRVLITGAAGRLGQVMADTLSELGASLVLVDLPASDIKNLSKKLVSRWGVKVETYYCDLEDNSQRSELIESIKNDEQKLNILINNAAFVGSSDLKGWSVPFEEQTLETWQRALQVNLTSVFDLSKGLSSKLSLSGHASIINIASIYGVLGPDYSLYEGTKMGNPAAYAASKGGLIQFTRWLSTTLAPSIRVNAISPGGIFSGQSDNFVKRYENKVPLERMGNEEDLKGIIAFLASDLSSYVTGQNIMIDGGWSAW